MNKKTRPKKTTRPTPPAPARADKRFGPRPYSPRRSTVIARTSIDIPIPLGNGRTGLVRLPRDVTRAEAEKISATIRTIYASPSRRKNG